MEAQPSMLASDQWALLPTDGCNVAARGLASSVVHERKRVHLAWISTAAVDGTDNGEVRRASAPPTRRLGVANSMLSADADGRQNH